MTNNNSNTYRFNTKAQAEHARATYGDAVTPVRFDPAGDSNRPWAFEWLSRYPLLAAGLASGTIAFEDHELVGRASDGVTVSLGYAYDAVERYLTEFPTPDTW